MLWVITVQPVFLKIVGLYDAGLGFVTSLLFVFFVGVFVSSWMGATVFWLGEWFIKRMPFVKHIYSASKQISAAISPGNSWSFFTFLLTDFQRLVVWCKNTCIMNINWNFWTDDAWFFRGESICPYVNLFFESLAIRECGIHPLNDTMGTCTLLQILQFD